MDTRRRVIAVALGLLFVSGIAACSQQTPSHQGTTVAHATQSAAPSDATTNASSTGLFGNDANLGKGTPTTKAVTEAPQTEPQPPQEFVQGSYTTNTDLTSTYWASDWCHYFVGTDGQTYGDSCARAALDANGNASNVLFLIYQYDPTKQDKLGTLALQLYTGYQGYTTYRNLNDPLFNQVQWAAFPTGVTAITADNFMVSFLDANGQLLWYTTQQILDMAAAARTNAGVPQATVPAWDPAITVWSYSMITSINNRIADIPSAAY
ncbi:MAG TPA: hypothetical protein VIM37_03665 [Candidatus Microsaccharimonas sp.]|jgi:hypothetical protein